MAHITAKPIIKLVLIFRVAAGPAEAMLRANMIVAAKTPEIPASDFNADAWSVAQIVESAAHPRKANGTSHWRPKFGNGGRRPHRSTAAIIINKMSAGTIPLAANNTNVGIKAKIMAIIFDVALDISVVIFSVIGAGSISRGFCVG